MKKQLISPRRLAEAASDAAFKIITADMDKKRDNLAGLRTLAEAAAIPDKIRAARLAEAQNFPDYVEPALERSDEEIAADLARAAGELAAADSARIINDMAAAAGADAASIQRAINAMSGPSSADAVQVSTGEKSNITDEHMEQIKNQFLESIRNKPAPAPEPKKLHELLVEPENPPPEIYFFAHGLAEAANWNRAAVQLWLNYLDAIEYDYMGLGMKNMMLLLPSIVETVRVTELNNANLPSKARMALVRRTLDKKTLSAVNRAQIAGNRAQRRAQQSTAVAGKLRYASKFVNNGLAL